MSLKNALQFYFILFFVGSSFLVYSEEIFDVETLPFFRSQQYSTNPYQKIVVFSAARTGSSLVYNILRYLFEEEKNLRCPHDQLDPAYLVLKTHHYWPQNKKSNENVLYIVPLRNPINACISFFKFQNDPNIDIKKFASTELRHHKIILQTAEILKSSGKSVAFVRYEDFENNLDYLISFIEQQLHISISETDKIIIKEGYKKENVCASIMHLKNFNECLPISGFHGNHISVQKDQPPAELIFWLNFYSEKIKPLFYKYGYFGN